jgi:hypothetical protein
MGIRGGRQQPARLASERPASCERVIHLSGRRAEKPHQADDADAHEWTPSVACARGRAAGPAVPSRMVTEPNTRAWTRMRSRGAGRAAARRAVCLSLAFPAKTPRLSTTIRKRPQRRTANRKTTHPGGRAPALRPLRPPRTPRALARTLSFDVECPLWEAPPPHLPSHQAALHAYRAVSSRVASGTQGPQIRIARRCLLARSIVRPGRRGPMRWVRVCLASVRPPIITIIIIPSSWQAAPGGRKEGRCDEGRSDAWGAASGAADGRTHRVTPISCSSGGCLEETRSCRSWISAHATGFRTRPGSLSRARWKKGFLFVGGVGVRPGGKAGGDGSLQFADRPSRIACDPAGDAEHIPTPSWRQLRSLCIISIWSTEQTLQFYKYSQQWRGRSHTHNIRAMPARRSCSPPQHILRSTTI